MDSERTLNGIFNGTTSIYILVKDDHRLGKTPIEWTLSPDIQKKLPDNNQHYMEFQMKYGIPLMNRLDWAEVKFIMSSKANKVNGSNNTSNFSEMMEMDQLETALKSMTIHVYAKFKVPRADKMVDQQELLYFGPSKEVAERTKQYFEEKYKSENSVDHILSKYTGVRDFVFRDIVMVAL